MIDRKPRPLLHAVRWLILICCGLITAYLFFIGGISVWIGLNHMDHDGFWMPILTGTLSILIVSWLFLRISKFLLNRVKDKEIINVYP